MSVEELKRIDASDLPFGKLIKIIAKSQEIYLNHHLEKLGITASHLHLLFEIAYQSELNQEKIAERCNINKGSVARSVKKLEDKGLVTRKIDDSNRRQNKVSLTSKGEKVLKESIKLLDHWEEEVLSENNVGNDELKKTLKQIAVKSIKMNREIGNE